MRKITLLFIFLAGFIANAQRTCGMVEKMQQIMSDPVKRQKFLDEERFVALRFALLRASSRE